MKKFILILILFLAVATHFYRLATVPPALNLDEVVMGYDAYSIFKTGHDQYGKYFPIYFQSHDDYKPPFIIYSQVISIALLGLSDFAVRLPSAVYGFLTVILVYLLSYEMFKSKKVGLMAALLLSISPWALQFTRTAYEVGIQEFLTSLGLYLFYKKRWLITGIILALGTHLYTASRVFIPMLMSVLLLVHKNFNRWLIIGFLIIFLPTVYLFTTPAGQVRFKGTNIFNNPIPHQTNVSLQIDDWLRRDRISATLFHPQKLEYLNEVLYGFFVHLRPDFIFLGNTDGSTNYVPKVGLEYLWELPFFIAGFYFLFKRPDKKPGQILLAWVILSAIPASVTYGIPTSIRTAIILPSLQIITAYGLIKSFRKWMLIFILPVFIYQTVFYFHMYYVHAPIERSQFWYPGYKQMVADANKWQKDYDQVIVSTQLDQPQSFFLYYLKYDPALYFDKFGGTVSGSYAENRNHFDKYFFKPIEWEKMKNLPKTLFVGRPTEIPESANVIKTYYYLNGQKEAVIATN